MISKPVASMRSPLFLRNEELERALSLLVFADIGLQKALLAMQEETGIGSGYLRILILIRSAGRPVTGDLKKQLGLPKQTLSKQLRHLTDRDLITSSIDGRDQRRHVISLTERGRELAERVLDRQRQVLRRAYSAAGTEAVEGFIAVLERLVEAGELFDGKRL